MLQKLNRETAGIKQTYPIKVLQFGDGNFMRGFMDWIIDILNEKTNFNSAVQIVRPLRNSKEVKKFEQEGLFHVVQRGLLNGITISETRLITCVTSVINPYSDFALFLKSAENPDLRFILSNTTEAGIAFSSNDTSINSIPESFPGKVTLLLYQRYNFFNKDRHKGVVFIPCELIEKNGNALRVIILHYIAAWNLPNDFKDWVLTNNTFCNTLVDRIVPGFPKEDAIDIQKSIGFEDTQLVMVEPFYSLVIEAPEYVRKIFPSEQAGLNVNFVDDITPYRIRKVRILNGAHTTLVPIAYLRGLRTVKESIHDLYVNEFLLKAIHEEIIPTLDLPENELKKYAADVIERFQNPFIRHELISISLNSISKFKVRVLPTILEYEKRTGKLPERLIHSLAALIVFYRGNWRGNAIPLNDSPEVLSFFRDAWDTNEVEGVVKKVLSNIAFWDCDLTKVSGLQGRVALKVTEIINTN
jgi:tagaturonate reductase